MGVSGNDVGTVEGNPQGHPARRFGAVNHLDAQMVVADGVCDAMSHEATCPELNLSATWFVVHQTDPVAWE
jgi:hypothetical protein